VELFNVWDYEWFVVEWLDFGVYGYYVGGVGDELMLCDNVEVYCCWVFCLWMFVDVELCGMVMIVFG